MSESDYRVALVTGASRGVGASVATLLAGRGSSIVVKYHSKRSRADDVAAAVRALGQRALVAQADLTSQDEVAAMMDSVRLEFGRIDTQRMRNRAGPQSSWEAPTETRGGTSRRHPHKNLSPSRLRASSLRWHA